MADEMVDDFVPLSKLRQQGLTQVDYVQEFNDVPKLAMPVAEADGAENKTYNKGKRKTKKSKYSKYKRKKK